MKTSQPSFELPSPFLNNAQQKQYERFQTLYKQLYEDNRFMATSSLLQRAARRFAQSTALIYKDTTITFAQLYHHSLQITKQLLSLGVKHQDKVCLLFENSVAYYECYFGIWQTGAVVAPLNTFLTERELIHIIEDCKPTVLIVSEEFSKKFDPSVFKNTQVLVVAQRETDSSQMVFNDEEYEIPYTDPDQMIALLYTSGTTGFPKGVMLSSRNILTNVIQIISAVEVSSADRLLAILPLFHSFAQNISVWSTFFLGASTIVVPKIERHWILDGFKHNPTVVIGVPVLYGLLSMMKHIDVSNVRYFVSGGDALPDKIRSVFELVFQRKLCNGYGLTEASPFIAADLDDELKPTNTIGLPALGIECSLRDELGNPIEKNQVGILWVKGDNIMLGYYNAPEATYDMLKDGWLNTGDFATFDNQGRLLIVGRFKDLIIHKGFNIYPQEIENILMSYPNMLKVAVIGIPDEQTGEVPVAYVVIKDAAADIEKQLNQLCMNALAAYKVPRHFIVLEDLPMTSLGKIDKKKLKQEFKKHMTTQSSS